MGKRVELRYGWRLEVRGWRLGLRESAEALKYRGSLTSNLELATSNFRAYLGCTKVIGEL
jgi:hypothetical protein